jgi:large subunit ribosomal protein L22
MRPAPQGRGYRVRKRSNHVTIVVDSKNSNTIPGIKKQKAKAEVAPVEEQAPVAKKEATKKPAAKKAAPKKETVKKEATAKKAKPSAEKAEKASKDKNTNK